MSETNETNETSEIGITIKDINVLLENIFEKVDENIFDMYIDAINYNGLSAYELIAHTFDGAYTDRPLDFLDKYFFCVDGFIVNDRTEYDLLLKERNESNDPGKDHKYLIETIKFIVDHYIKCVYQRDCFEAGVIRNMIRNETNELKMEAK